MDRIFARTRIPRPLQPIPVHGSYPRACPLSLSPSPSGSHALVPPHSVWSAPSLPPTRPSHLHPTSSSFFPILPICTTPSVPPSPPPPSPPSPPLDSPNAFPLDSPWNPSWRRPLLTPIEEGRIVAPDVYATLRPPWYHLGLSFDLGCRLLNYCCSSYHYSRWCAPSLHAMAING